MPQWSILLVTHNSASDLETCLAALTAQTHTDWEALVVDNASTDGTWERLAAWPRATLRIRNATNAGFPAALNQTLAQARGEWVLTLNPDVELAPACLARLDEAARHADPRVGLLSPKLLRSDRCTIDSTGLMVSRAWRVRDRGAGEPDRGQYDARRTMLGPCAAAGAYRRAMLESLRQDGQIFDAAFFLLMEDVDLAWRAQRAGWQGRYVPDAVAYHRGGLSRRRCRQAQALSFRNRYYLIAKHHRWSWRDAAWLLGYDAPRLAWLLCTNPDTLPMAWQVFRRWPSYRRARRW